MTTTFAVRTAHGQSPGEGTVRLIPAMSDVPGDGGPFTVYVVGQDLRHDGSIQYDDNRDGTPDRSVSSDGIAAFEVEIDYNAAILAVGGIESGPELGRTGRTFQCLPPDRKPGKVSFACASFGASPPPGVTGTLTLASIQFNPQGGGLSPLALDARVAGPLGDSVNVTVTGGAARVSGAVPPTATEAGSSPASASSPVPGSTPGPDGSTTPGEAGTPTPPQTREGIETATAQAATTQRGTAAALASAATARATPKRDPASSVSSGDSGGGGFGGATLWSAIVAGSIGAGGLLTLGAMVWRQRQHRGQV